MEDKIAVGQPVKKGDLLPVSDETLEQISAALEAYAGSLTGNLYGKDSVEVLLGQLGDSLPNDEEKYKVVVEANLLGARYFADRLREHFGKGSAEYFSSAEIDQVARRWKLPILMLRRGDVHFQLVLTPPVIEGNRLSARVYDPMRKGELDTQMTLAYSGNDGWLDQNIAGPVSILPLAEAVKFGRELDSGDKRVIPIWEALGIIGYDLRLNLTPEMKVLLAKNESVQRGDAVDCGAYCLYHAAAAMAMKPGESEFKRVGLPEIERLTGVHLITYEEARAAREEARRGVEVGLAKAEKTAEVELTLEEKVFAAMVEDLVDWEEAAGAVDGEKLQKVFENIRSQFGRLPAGGRFRTKVMENVMSQLGGEGEKMIKARKSDEQIFEEWLKRVFIPLYRRTAKK